MATSAVHTHSRSSAHDYPAFTEWRNYQCERDAPDEADLLVLTRTASHHTDFEVKDDTPVPSLDVPIKGMNYWERLRAHNKDYWWRYRKEVDVWASCDRRYKKAVVEHYAHYLGLTTVEYEDIFRDVMNLQMPRVGHPVEVVIFCRCALEINNRARRAGLKNVYHPQHKTLQDNDFAKLEEDILRQYPRINKSRLTSIYAKWEAGSLPTRDPTEWKPYFRHDYLVPQDPSHPPSFNPTDHT